MKPRTLEQILSTNTILRHKAGSHSYGTNIETSDLDIRGIFVADPINIRTPFYPIHEVDIPDEEDSKLYELSKYMKLALECNPNIIESLYVDNDDILYSTPAYEKLRAHRYDFLSSKIAFTTSGYAISQLKRIKGHKKWINQPQPKEAPQPYQFITMVQWFDSSVKMMPRDFDIMNFNKDYRLVPYGNQTYGLYPMRGFSTITEQGALNENFEGAREEIGPPLAIIKWNRDVYAEAKERHSQYWTWKNNRNKIRSELEEKYEIDTKHAMHLVRLLRIGKEALTTGEILVKRPDAKELLEIRNGAWSYEEVVKYAESMDKEIQEVHYKNTKLPKYPNLNQAAKVLMEVQDIMWSK